MVDKVEEYRAVPKLVEQDDDAMVAYLEGNEPTLRHQEVYSKGTINLPRLTAVLPSRIRATKRARRRSDYLPCPAKPQPEVNAEGEETGEFA